MSAMSRDVPALSECKAVPCHFPLYPTSQVAGFWAFIPAVVPAVWRAVACGAKLCREAQHRKLQQNCRKLSLRRGRRDSGSRGRFNLSSSWCEHVIVAGILVFRGYSILPSGEMVTDDSRFNRSTYQIKAHAFNATIHWVRNCHHLGQKFQFSCHPGVVATENGKQRLSIVWWALAFFATCTSSWRGCSQSLELIFGPVQSSVSLVFCSLGHGHCALQADAPGAGIHLSFDQTFVLHVAQFATSTIERLGGPGERPSRVGLLWGDLRRSFRLNRRRFFFTATRSPFDWVEGINLEWSIILPLSPSLQQ